MKKIVIINSILSPYSNERYNELNKNPNVDLYVLFHAKLDNARGWDSILLEIKYKKINLKNIHISLSSERVSSLNINYNTYAVLKRINPDRVIICGWDSIATFLALIYCKINKKELILWAGSTEFEKSWLRIISKFYVKWVIKQCDGFISYGTKATEYLMSFGAKKKIFNFYNSIDVDYFKEKSRLTIKEKNNLKKDYNLPLENKIITYVGRLAKIKCVDVLISSFKEITKKHKNLTLLIIGKGKESKNLKKIAYNNKNIKFLGTKNIKELPKFYGLTDLFVLPSKEEPWGLVINEAMASKCAIIATDKCGSSYDLIMDNGLIVKSENELELKNAIEEIILDEKKLNYMKERSEEIISQMTNKKLIKKIDYFR